jgi:hypothetical protein
MEGLGTGQPEERPAPEQLAREDAAPPREELTLSTICACGHSRKYHMGLSMEVKGRCLECGCAEFMWAVPESPEQIMERIRAGLDQVQRLRESVASLCDQLGDEGHNGRRGA